MNRITLTDERINNEGFKRADDSDIETLHFRILPDGKTLFIHITTEEGYTTDIHAKITKVL